jgi:DMSO/TMAO reductase YedYZ molybdopterin-dependent catalytic subunit
MGLVRRRRDDVNRRTFLRLAAAGLSSAFIPLAELGCAKKLSQQLGASSTPTPEAPFTRTDDWYYVSIVDPANADLERYRLKIGGIVDNGLSISVPALRTRFENVIQPITHACVGNPPEGSLVSSGYFRGVRVRDVLDAAKISDRAEAAIITGLDGYVALQSMKELVRPESIFAFEMGRSPEELEPLPVVHGFPLRIMTPGLYGYMQPKWIDTVTIADQRGYQDVLRGSVEYAKGHIQLASGFSHPFEGQVIKPGNTKVVGYSFGDGRPIAFVDVRIDGVGWQRAEIVFNKPFDDMPPFVWVVWVLQWNAPPGEHTLEARATYEDGTTQFEGHRFPYSGGTIPRIPVTVLPPR